MHPKQGIDGLTFMNVTEIETEIVHIDKIQVNLSNLFVGNRERERCANDLFIDNWRVLFDICSKYWILSQQSICLLNFLSNKYIFVLRIYVHINTSPDKLKLGFFLHKEKEYRNSKSSCKYKYTLAEM